MRRCSRGAMRPSFACRRPSRPEDLWTAAAIGDPCHALLIYRAYVRPRKVQGASDCATILLDPGRLLHRL